MAKRVTHITVPVVIAVERTAKGKFKVTMPLKKRSEVLEHLENQCDPHTQDPVYYAIAEDMQDNIDFHLLNASVTSFVLKWYEAVFLAHTINEKSLHLGVFKSTLKELLSEESQEPHKVNIHADELTDGFFRTEPMASSVTGKPLKTKKLRK